MRIHTLLLFALLIATANAEETPEGLKCPTAEELAGKKCNGDDAGKLIGDCRTIGGAISAQEKKYSAEVTKCVKKGGSVNTAGRKKARGAQAPVQEDTSKLLEENRALLANCAKTMGEIQKAFLAESKKLEPKISGANVSAGCKPAAQTFYKAMKKQADDGAAFAKAKEGEYNKAAGSMEAKSEVTKNNAAGMGGDSNKSGDSKGESKGGGAGGGGGGDPSAMMKAMGDMAKMKQDQDAKKDAEEKAAAAKEKARLAQEKAARVAQCRANERDRATEIQNCKNDHHVDTRYTIVLDVQTAQKDCIDGVNNARGTAVTNCELTP
jgi:hypothetical protein